MPHLNMSLDYGFPNQSSKKELPERHTKLPTHNTSKVKEWIRNLMRASKLGNYLKKQNKNPLKQPMVTAVQGMFHMLICWCHFIQTAFKCGAKACAWYKGAKKINCEGTKSNGSQIMGVKYPH